MGKTTKTLQNWQKYVPVPVVGWERETKEIVKRESKIK
jgi:hypothetical protein